jgi:hypothetical protein
MTTSSPRNLGLAVLAVLACAAALAPQAAMAADPPGYTLARQGDMHDFDFLGGAWTTVQRRLKARNVGSRDWDEFPAQLCLTHYLDGIANVDELHMPTLGGRGEFYGEDKDGDKPVKVRFIWESLDRDHARWAQAFSYDDKTWETNWTGDFTRADPAKLCDQGRPRRG